MAPIRVGILGLTAIPSSWAPRAHLQYLLDSPHYTIHGMCNSSLASTKAAIKAHNLPDSTRAYDSPKALAADPDVDLVVVCTRVDTHYALTKPALLAGKNTFVEWPLGANLEQAKELFDLAKEKNVKTVIGLQARMSPAVHKLHELVNSVKLGKIYSVSVLAATAMADTTASEKYAYFADKSTGGNMLTIHTMHILDAIFYVHGELQPNWTPVLANQIPYVDIEKADGTVERKPKDSADHVAIAGRFEDGAVFSFHVRRGNLFPGVPGLTWRVYAEKGQLDVTADAMSVNVGSPVTVRYTDSKAEKSEVLVKPDELEGEAWMKLPMPGRNIGRIYEAYATGTGGYGDWKHAVKRHEFVEKIYREGGM
jgi:predicted dehydrogenase